MANLEFCDTHNMVAYLLKIEGSEDTGEVQITATIDGKVKLVSEASIRRHLKLEDSDGISTLPNTKIFEQLALMGNIATAIICLATNMTFSKMIFEGMVKNLDKDDQSGGCEVVGAPEEVQERHEQEIKFETNDISTAKTLQRQERAGYEAAVRLQELLDEEERQMIARVHEEASSFNVEEWEDIQATIKADEELALRIQVEEREKYYEAEKQDCL
nr:hypothetical protein [Tanacetum cinerariifolium]